MPRILPCHHTICEACLLGIAQAADQRLFTLRVRNDSPSYKLYMDIVQEDDDKITNYESSNPQYLQCPSCRQESIFPNGSVKNFEVDFRVNRLIEVLERLQQVLFTFGIENELSSENSETVLLISYPAVKESFLKFTKLSHDHAQIIVLF